MPIALEISEIEQSLGPTSGKPCVLYAIMSTVQPSGSAKNPDWSMLRGIGDQPIFSIQTQDLEVAASQLNDMSPLTQPDTASILTYSKVVAALHASCDLLPLRYGSWAKGTEEAQQFLAKNRAAYTSMLSAMTGCTEMSVSLLMKTAIPEAAPPEVAPSEVAHRPSGAKYMGALLRLHQKQNELVERLRAVGQHCSGVLSAWSVNRKEELVPAFSDRGSQTNSLVLHFLVKRQNIQQFRTAFRILQEQSPVPMLLSGPWPPYNFSC